MESSVQDWHRHFVKEQKEDTHEHRKTLLKPVKGAEFVKPLSGFYCALCKEIFLDESSVEQHLKGHHHYVKYDNFNKGAPLYERKRLFKRFIKMAVAAKEKKVVIIDDTEQKEEEKKKKKEEKKNQEAAAAERKSKEILLKEKSKEVKVIELEGEDSEDLHPSSNQKATNIKLNLSEKDKDKSNSTKFVFIGKAPNYKKTQPQKPASQKPTPWYKREDILNKKESDADTSSNVTNAVEKVTKTSQSPDIGTFKSTFKNVQEPLPNSIKKPEETSSSKSSFLNSTPASIKKPEETSSSKSSFLHSTPTCSKKPEETSSSKSSLSHKDKTSVVENKNPDVKQIKKSQSDSFAHNIKLSEIALPETSSSLPSSSNANVPQPMDIDNSQDVKSKPKSEEEKDFLLLSINKEDFQPLVVPVPPPTSMVSYPIVPSVQTVSSNISCVTSSSPTIQNKIINALDFSVPPPAISVPPPTISVPPPTISVPPPTIAPYQNNSQHMSIYGNQNNTQNIAPYSYPTNNPQMSAYSNSPQISLQTNYQNMLPYSTPPPAYRNPPPVLPYSNTGKMPPAPQYSYTNNMPYNTYSNSMPANQSYEPSMYPLPSNNQTQYPIPNASQNLAPPGSESIRKNNTKINVVTTNVSSHVPQSKTSPTLQKTGNLITIVPEETKLKVSESGKDNKPVKLEKTTPKINVQVNSNKVTSNIPAANNVAKGIKNVVKHETEKTSNAVKFNAKTLKTSKIVGNIEKSSNANSNGKEKTIETINSLLKQSMESQVKHIVYECIKKIELKEQGNSDSEKDAKSTLIIDMPVVFNNSASTNHELIKSEQIPDNEASNIKSEQTSCNEASNVKSEQMSFNEASNIKSEQTSVSEASKSKSEQMSFNEVSHIKSENKVDENISGKIFMKICDKQFSATSMEVDDEVLGESSDNISSLVDNSNKGDEVAGGDKENNEVNVTTKATEKVVKDNIHATSTVLRESTENAASDSMFSASEVAGDRKENEGTVTVKAGEKMIEDNAYDCETILKESNKNDSISHGKLTGDRENNADENIIENNILDNESILKEGTQNVINSANESSYDETSKVNPEENYDKQLDTEDNIVVKKSSVESCFSEESSSNEVHENDEDIEMTHENDENKNSENDSEGKSLKTCAKQISRKKEIKKTEKGVRLVWKFKDGVWNKFPEGEDDRVKKSSSNFCSLEDNSSKTDKVSEDRENTEVTTTIISKEKNIEGSIHDSNAILEQSTENVKNDSVLVKHKQVNVNNDKLIDSDDVYKKSIERRSLAENSINEKSEDVEMTNVSTMIEEKNINSSCSDKNIQNENIKNCIDTGEVLEVNKNSENIYQIPMSVSDTENSSNLETSNNKNNENDSEEINVKIFENLIQSENMEIDDDTVLEKCADSISYLSGSSAETNEAAENKENTEVTMTIKYKEKIIEDSMHDSDATLEQSTENVKNDSVLPKHEQINSNNVKEFTFEETSKANPEKDCGKLIVTGDNVSEKSIECCSLTENPINEKSYDVEMTNVSTTIERENISDSFSNKNVENENIKSYVENIHLIPAEEKGLETLPKQIESEMNDLKCELLSMVQSVEVDDGTSLEKSSDNIYSAAGNLDKTDKLPEDRENTEVTITVSKNKIIEDSVYDGGAPQEQNTENVKNDSVLDTSFYEIFKVNHEKVCDKLVEESDNITLEKSTEHCFLAEDSSNNITEKSEDIEMPDISTIVEDENIGDSCSDKKTQNEDTRSHVTFSVGADENDVSEENKTLPCTEVLPMSVDGIVDSNQKDSNVTDLYVNILAIDKNEVGNLKCEEGISDQDLKGDSNSELTSSNVKKQRKRKGRKTCSKKVLKTDVSLITNEENVKDEPCINILSERQTRSKKLLKTDVSVITNEEIVKDEPSTNILSERQTRSKRVLKTGVSSITNEENAKDGSNLKCGEGVSHDLKDDNNSQLTSSNVKKQRGKKGRKTRGKKVLKTCVTSEENAKDEPPSLCSNPDAVEENNQTSSGEEEKFENISSQGENLEDFGMPTLEKVIQDIDMSEDKAQDTHLKLDKKSEDSRNSEDEAKASLASGSQDSEKCENKNEASAQSATEEKENAGHLCSSKSPKKSSSDLKNTSTSDTEEYEDDDEDDGEEEEEDKMNTE